MSPEQLKSYLEVLRGMNLMSGHVKIPVYLTDGSVHDLELAVVFGPEPLAVDASAPAAPLTPGGWKGPEKLDQHFDIEELPPLKEQPYRHPVDPEHPEKSE